MKLTQNFTLSEMTRSDSAVRLKIDNTPPEAIIANLRRLCELLEVARALIGRPIRVTSGYRSPALNKAIGGKEASQHRLGCAADIVVSGMTAAQVMQKLADAPELCYDQLILEEFSSEWVHISVPNAATAKPRRQALHANRAGIKPYTGE